MAYLDTLSDRDLFTLEIVTDDVVVEAIRLGAADKGVMGEVKRMDVLLKEAPKLSKPLTLYKAFTGDGASTLKDADEIKDPAFLTGTVSKPSKGVVFKLNIPAGIKAIDLGDGAYILPRNLKIKPSGQTSENGTPSDVSLHLIGQHDQSSHGAGGGGGSAKGALKPSDKKSKKAKILKNIAIAAAVTVAVVGVIAVGKSVNEKKAMQRRGSSDFDTVLKQAVRDSKNRSTQRFNDAANRYNRAAGPSGSTGRQGGKGSGAIIVPPGGFS